LELTSGSLRKKHEGKSRSNSLYTSRSSGCSSRDISGLLEQTVHLTLADFSLTEGICVVLYQVGAGAAVVLSVLVFSASHGYFDSILESEISEALHFNLFLILFHHF